MQADFEKNKAKLMQAVGKAIKDRRNKTGKTMYLISAECSMSKSTWREAELGICKDINLATLWRISEGLEIKPYDLIEEIYKNLDNKFSLIDA